MKRIVDEGNKLQQTIYELHSVIKSYEFDVAKAQPMKFYCFTVGNVTSKECKGHFYSQASHIYLP